MADPDVVTAPLASGHNGFVVGDREAARKERVVTGSTGQPTLHPLLKYVASLDGEIRQLDDLLPHLAAAIGKHARDLSRDGLRPPPLLLELGSWALELARLRQRATELDEAPDLLDLAPMEKLLLTKHEVSRLLHVSVRTVERLVADGRLQMLKVEGAARFRRADVDAYVSSLAGSPTFRDHTETKGVA